MFFSGVEYAVVFPTLWEYLQHLGVPVESTYWLGLTISAMTLTDMVAGLLVGHLLDTTLLRTKFLVLMLNLAQILGSALYLTSSLPIMLVVSRLISGCGKSITIVFLADICRSTDCSERTPILLLFNIAFQVGLLIGPACNLVFDQVDVDTFFGHLSNLNSPGLLMASLWVFFSLLVAALYSDLVSLKEKEAIERELASAYVTVESSDYSPLVRGSNSNSPHPVNIDRESPENLDTTSEDDNENEEFPVVFFTAADATYPCSLPARPLGRLTPIPSPRSFRTRVEDIHLINSRETCSRYGSVSPRWEYDRNAIEAARVPKKKRRSQSRSSRKSNIFIDEAERLMGDSDSDGSEDSGRGSGLHSAETSGPPSDGEPDPPHLTWHDYWEMLSSEEIVVLIFLRFVALFCQTSLESVVPPIMQTYFDYGDLANSLLYLAAGLELIVVFLLLSLASKLGTPDSKLVGLGLLIMAAALTYLTIMLPSLTPHSKSDFPLFCIGVFVDLAGIPTVCDVGLALYSKLVSDQMQGFGQATRRFVSQLAILMGPLWGGGTFTTPALMVGIPLGLLLLGALMFFLSYDKMKPVEDRDN
jgi:predicted MFS family arabinose efflux permease